MEDADGKLSLGTTTVASSRGEMPNCGESLKVKSETCTTDNAYSLQDPCVGKD